jgi:hypothetical protein
MLIEVPPDGFIMKAACRGHTQSKYLQGTNKKVKFSIYGCGHYITTWRWSTLFTGVRPDLLSLELKEPDKKGHGQLGSFDSPEQNSLKTNQTKGVWLK